MASLTSSIKQDGDASSGVMLPSILVLMIHPHSLHCHEEYDSGEKSADPQPQIDGSFIVPLSLVTLL